METLGMTDVALHSLAEEVLPTLHVQYAEWLLQHSEAHPDMKNAFLQSLQVCRFANEGSVHTSEIVWYRALEVVNNCLISLHRSLPHNAVLEEDLSKADVVSGTRRTDDFGELKRFWRECKMPPDDELWNVIARSVLILALYQASFTTSARIIDPDADHTNRCLDVLWSDPTISQVFQSRSLPVLCARCNARYKSQEDDPTASDPVSELRRMLNRPSKSPDPTSRVLDDWIGHLLPGNK
jgi:hypothetical protein